MFHLSLVLAYFLPQLIGPTDGAAFYQVPNPFREEQRGYYAIRSLETIISNELKSRQTMLTEFFSLDTGLTYSLHQDRDRPDRTFALIGDGPRGRSYIVRNPDEPDENQLDCELDHTHHHRQVFPYQYVYDAHRPANDKKRKRRRWWSKRFVYGVGAVWLNAIERKIVSDEVALDGQSANIWVMRDGDLEVRLLFGLPKNVSRSNTPEQQVLEQLQLNHIGISRKVTITSPFSDGGGLLVGSGSEEIEVQSFVSEVDTSTPQMQRFFTQLASCRRDNKGQRLFPSLMRAVNTSPDRLYRIAYLEQKFNSFYKGLPPQGQFSEKHHRNLHDVEFHSEWFSFERQMQVDVYEGVPDYPDDQVHVFMKNFTGRPAARSSRHSTVHYHVIEAEDSFRMLSCKQGEQDPAPIDKLHLLLRSVHFRRSNSSEVEHIGKLTGLGALLMNAADLHYKQFNLFKRTVNVVYDLNNLAAREKVQVDEWQLEDSKGRVVHFYFRSKQLEREPLTVEDLVRVELRSAPRDKPDTDVIEPAEDEADADDAKFDLDLLIRWDILRLETRASEETKNFIFTVPDICKNSKEAPDEAPADEDDAEDDKDWEPEEDFDKDHYHDLANDDPEEGEEEDQRDAQKDGEDFEMERPGALTEEAQVPDFWNFVQGANGYKINSIVELLSSDDETEQNERNKIYLSEQMDLTTNLAHLAVYTSLSSQDAHLEYYINYNARMMFQVDGTKGTCQKVEQPESWLRLLSTRLTYYRANSDHSVIEEEDKLRMFGVAALWRQAAESEWIEFLGGRKDLVEDSNGYHCKELVWALAEDDDQNMRFKFKFWLPVHENKNREEKKHSNIKLESIFVDELMEDTDAESLFRPFRVQPSSLDTFAETLTLPQVCQDILVEASKVDFFAHVEFPPFSTVYSNTNAYRILYRVTMAPRHRQRDHQHRLSVTQILESFDRKMNLGHLVLGNGPEMKEVFIDGNKKVMYLFSAGRCKPIHSLKGLVDEDSNFLDENEEFSLDKMYGLGALWIRLTRMTFTLEKKYQHDEYGNPIQSYIYRAIGGDTTTKFAIQAEFVLHGVGPGRRFELQSIKFLPNRWRMGKNQVELHRTNIEVDSMNNNYSARNWNLPDECAGEMPLEEVKLPRWSDLIGSMGQFYARSELTFLEGQHMSQGEMIYLMDEWFHDGDLRLKSFGSQDKFDFLIYTKTGEAFDIGTRYRCDSKLPKMNRNWAQASDNSLLKFWSLQEAKDMDVAELAELYYSPISLWRLADSNTVNVKLSNSLELAPKPKTSNLSKLDVVERELRERTWEVSHPRGLWSYDMTFEQFSMVDLNGQRRQWFVLNRITARDKSSLEHGVKPVIDINMVNYRYQHDPYDWWDTFLLPEGYGCRRSIQVEEMLAQTLDSLFLARSLAHSISYEAALVRVTIDEDPQLGRMTVSKSVLPTVVGTLFRVQRKPQLDVWINFVSTRYLNGTTVSTQTVHDQVSSLSFDIDQATGYCKIGHHKDRLWSLEFPELEPIRGSQVVELNDEFFKILTNEQINYQHPLNVYTRDGKVITSYEESFSMVRLNDRFQRPATVIRRYEQPVEIPTAPNVSKHRDITLHTSMAVEVMLFDEGRHKLEAVLNFDILQATHLSLQQFMGVMDVSSCYNDGDGKMDIPLRTFAIEYQCYRTKREPNLLDGASVEESFITSFLDKAQIMPTQLVGSPRMTFNQDQSLISFTFSLLEAPTSIELDSQLELGKRASLQLEALAEVTLTPSLWDCSRWCDDIGCRFMSYCLDRTCRVWTNFDVSQKESLPINMSNVTQVDDPSCTYWRLLGKRPITLDKFAGQMETFINSFHADSSEFKSLYKLDTGRYCQTLTPRRFYEILDNFESADSDQIRDEHSAENYKIEGQNLRLKVPLTNKMNTFTLTLEHVLSYSQCLATCSRTNCLLFSYCSSDKSCSVIAGSGDLRLLREELEETTTDEMGCSISVRDLLVKYIEFESTREPASYERKLDGYSDLDCAAMCDTVQEPNTCLSFDVCSTAATQTTCYLQKEHIIQDSFDRSILTPDLDSSPRANDSAKLVNCKHFSKSVLADFKQMINRQLSPTKGEQSVRGNSAEKCAHECRDDQQCYGFEHCFDHKSKPAQSCQFVRSNDNFKPDTLHHLYKYLQDQSASSDKCSIYSLRHFPEEFTIDSKGPVAWVDNIRGFMEHSGTQVTPRLTFIVRVMYYVMSSIFAGLLIQFAYIKVSGRLSTCRQ